MPLDRGWFLVFEIRLDGLNCSSPPVFLQQNRGGGDIISWWSSPVVRGIFVCLIITPSSCASFCQGADHGE